MTKQRSGSVRSALPDLENIDWLISRIESHWQILSEDSVRSEFMQKIRDQYRRDWLENPKFIAPSRPLADALEQLFGAGLDLDVPMQEAIENALLSALTACQRRLTEVELARLGWELTRLVALDIQPIKDALDKARKAGGTATGDAAREQFRADAAATCDAARRIIDGRKSEARSLSNAELVNLLAKQGHGTAPTIRARLRTQCLYPATRKKKAD